MYNFVGIRKAPQMRLPIHGPVRKRRWFFSYPNITKVSPLSLHAQKQQPHPHALPASTSLTGVGETASVPLVRALASDLEFPKPAVRAAVKVMLWHLDRHAGLPVLRELITGKDGLSKRLMDKKVLGRACVSR